MKKSNNKITKEFDGLTYHQAQKRNSELFNSFSKVEQKTLRRKGYKNIGWKNVINSWFIMNNFMKNEKNKVIKIRDYQLKKAELKYEKAKESEDLIAVLNAGYELIEAIEMKYK